MRRYGLGRPPLLPRPGPVRVGPDELGHERLGPLFTATGIRVRAHASLLITCVLILLFGTGFGFGETVRARVEYVSVLFAVVLLHEFGHCFMARWVGGSADDILMTPLGGLAFANPPHRWRPTLLTVAAGPAVNVMICLTAGSLVWILTGTALPWVPLPNHSVGVNFHSTEWVDVTVYAFRFYFVSWWLLLFNVLPVYPLDGGQMLRAGLWGWFGYYRASLYAFNVGLVGSVLMLAFGLAEQSLLLAFIAVSCGWTCYVSRMQLLAAGPYEYGDDGVDYSAAYDNPARRRKPSRGSLRAAAKANKAQVAEAVEREQVDRILAKVSATGMASLTRGERRTLKQATEHRRRQTEVTR